MDNVIDFPKPEPERPDDDCTCIIVTDGKPVRWFKFCCSFTGSDGKQYGFQIWATDYAQAEEMMASLRVSAMVDGQLFAEVPA